MLNSPILEQWSEYMDYVITLVLILLEKRMKHLKLNTGIVRVLHNTRNSEIIVFENKLEEHLR